MEVAMPESSQIYHACLLLFDDTCHNTRVDGEASPLFSNVVVIPFLAFVPFSPTGSNPAPLPGFLAHGPDVSPWELRALF